MGRNSTPSSSRYSAEPKAEPELTPYEKYLQRKREQDKKDEEENKRKEEKRRRLKKNVKNNERKKGRRKREKKKRRRRRGKKNLQLERKRRRKQRSQQQQHQNGVLQPRNQKRPNLNGDLLLQHPPPQRLQLLWMRCPRGNLGRNLQQLPSLLFPP